MKTPLFLLLFILLPLSAQEVTLAPEDLYIETDEEGFHLWVKKQPDINSVMITESTEDPEDERSVFAYRAFDYNEINGSEKRILNGEFLDAGYNFLLDSTPEDHELLGEAFHIYIPSSVTYGYPWSREGQVDIGEGSWINLRTFPLPFGDYSEGFSDNPFIFATRMPEPEIAAPEEEVSVAAALLPETPAVPAASDESVFEEVARETDGEFATEVNGDGAVDRIGKILDKYKGKEVDLALVVDTTVSMKDDVEFIRKRLIPLVEEKIEGFKSVRIGLVLYRDYKESYLTRSYPLEEHFGETQRILDSIKVAGGRDIPEAVFEGLWEAQTAYDWQGEEKIIVQIGDAPPHDEPRGEVTREMVYEYAREEGISIYPILLEDEKRTSSAKS